MEYVATIGSAIGQRAEIELRELAVLGGDEDAGDFGSSKRHPHRFCGVGPHDDRLAGVERLAEDPHIDCLEDEHVVGQCQLALDCDLRHLAPGRAEPALSHSSMLPPGSTSTMSTPAGASSRKASGVPVSSSNVPQ